MTAPATLSPGVTLETKCWQGDWEVVLKSDWLHQLAEGNRYAFACRTLVVNNVADREQVRDHAERARARGWIDRIVFVDDHISDALAAVRLTRAELGHGYVYSSAELVGLHLCETEYLLHFASDAMPEAHAPWIDAALERMRRDRRIKVANPTWNGLFQQARAESLEEDEDFWIGYGFSDQCYLVRTSDFHAPIYGASHPASARYPDYGGALFEKRVDSWMRSHGWLRATFRHASYVHRNHRAPLQHRLRAQWHRLRRVFSRTIE